MTLAEHVKKFQTTFDRLKKIHAAIGVRFSVNPSMFLYRNQYMLINLFTNVYLGLVTTREAAFGQLNLGQTIEKWRSLSKSYEFLSRHILAMLTATNDPIRVAQVEVVAVGLYSRSTIIKCFKDGVRLGLLRQEDGEYFGTDLLYNEAFERCVTKIYDKRIVEFAEMVLMANSMGNVANRTGETELKSPFKDKGQEVSITEALFYRQYDGEVFGHVTSDDAEHNKSKGDVEEELFTNG